MNLKNILRNVGNYLKYEIFSKWSTLNNIIKRGRKTILHTGHLIPNSLVIHTKILFEVEMFKKQGGTCTEYTSYSCKDII